MCLCVCVFVREERDSIFPIVFQIDRLKPLRSMIRLKVLYMAHNYVREWREFEHLCELPNLEDLVRKYFKYTNIQ